VRRSGVERQEVLAKLRAIRKNVVEHVATQARHFDPLYVLDLFERYATVRDALKAVLPSLFEDLPVREDPTSRTAEHEGRGSVEMVKLRQLLHDIDYCLELLQVVGAAAAAAPPTEGSGQPSAPPHPQRVLVIYGRNEAARRAMFAFLRVLRLEPIEWTQAIRLAHEGAPYIGAVLDRLFETAQAVVVILSGDDEAKLRDPFLQADDSVAEKRLTPQPRMNVIFEAGMAFARAPSRTILVELESVRPFSDIAGRHIVRFLDDARSRQELARRLETAGCAVDLSGADWQTEGDFAGAKPSAGDPPAADGKERRRRPPTFLWRGVEWVLGPDFWGAYEYLSGDEISPALLNSAIRSPICPQCKEDAKAAMESGNQCLTCGQAFHLGTVVSAQPWEELKREVYKKAQAAARRGELHLD